MQSRAWPLSFCCALILASATADAQTAANVLVVANEASPDSLEIAAYYAQVRKIPDSQVLRIRSATSERIARLDFTRDIQDPIARWLMTNAAADRILYIVLTKGVPIRIDGTTGRRGSAASVDSELTVLYRRLAGSPALVNGAVPNPYFAGSGLESAKPFSHVAQDIYLVTRLDGFTVADVRALIDRGAAPKPEGRILLDQSPTAPGDPRNRWLEAAAATLKAKGLGDRVLLEDTARPLQNEPDVLGYFSWASNDPNITKRSLGLGFVPGALAATYASTDGRTFIEPPADWQPRSRTSRAFAGTADSLAGDLIRGGATGVAASVREPYIDGVVRPDVLFPAYVAGFNLAEAYYLATPSLSWQTIVIGDPLCAPFRTAQLPAEEADPGMDAETELPKLVSARRIARMAAAGKLPAVKSMIRGETRMAKGDVGAAQEAFERAVQEDDTLLIAWRALAQIHEEQGRHAQANDIYRRLIAADKSDVVALNNLAYNLAVREGKLQEAREFARRAFRLTPGAANVADTLGWIEHLLGNDQEALRLLEPASRAVPPNAEILLHASVVYAALGRVDAAAKALKRAEEADATIVERPEYKHVQRRITGGRTESAASARVPTPRPRPATEAPRPVQA